MCFAQALLSSATDEIRPLLVQARDWAKCVNRPVRMWMSDKQDAFVTLIASEFPGVPHRYCANHFLRDLAKPVLELDSHAKVQMRSKIRGLRGIEREVLKSRAADRADRLRERKRLSPALTAAAQALDVVLEYCAAVRGIINDNQGGPLRPPGLRMSEALREVQKSLSRNVRLKKGAWQNVCWSTWRTASTKADRSLSTRSSKWHCTLRRSNKWT